MSYDEPKAEVQAPRVRKTNREVMVWLLDRMRRRAAGRERLKTAERKRRNRAMDRLGTGLVRNRHHSGLVDDADYGVKACVYYRGQYHADRFMWIGLEPQEREKSWLEKLTGK